MKLESMMNIIVPAVFAANIAYANEAKVATPIETASMIQNNDDATNASEDNKQDWRQQKRLINSDQVTVLIQPVQDKPGYCVVGLDGFPQKYDLPADKRIQDNILEKSEWILNLSESNPENKFYFSCDRKAETPKPTAPTTPTIPIVPEPSKLPFLRLSPGASYLQIFGNEDETYDFSGILSGGSLALTVQPIFTNWYFGGRFSAYGNASSDHADFEVPATEGPLAGQLVMRGKNDHSLENFGIGAGAMFGYLFPLDTKERWGIGVELEQGIMHDWTARKFTESSAHYINGNILEGSDASNHSDNADNKFYGYLMPGLRIKFPFICGTFSGGIRTDVDDIDGMFSAGIAYCPNWE